MIDVAFWNYLIDCYQEKSLTKEDMDIIMVDDREAFRFWQEFCDEVEFVEFVREQLVVFMRHLKKREKDE